jgi:hypothetical protein
MFEKQYLLKGKHATYAKFLSATTERLNKDAKVAGVFRYIIDVYLVAPLIGVAYNLKADEDTTSNDDVRIFADAIINQQENLTYAYRLVMLSENSSNLTNDEKIDRAFKQDEDVEKLANNMELFHQYMRGGIEWLYEQFTDGATTKEDYLSKIQEVVETFKADFSL